jgi:hypothetical protein
MIKVEYSMELNIKKTLLAGAVLFSLSANYTQAFELCGDKTLDRQGDVPINEMQCITDYGHYFYFTVPYENSEVTITTSGGLFNFSDAELTLYSGDYWDNNEIELQSNTPDSNEESISFVSRAGERYFYISGNIEQTSLLVSVTGGDIPEPMGDYIVFDTNIPADLPTPILTSKAQYGDVIATILAASWSDFEGIASAADDPLTDVTNTLHYLAASDDLTDPDLNQLLYFMGSYKYYADKMTDEEAANLSIAMQAVAKMSGFLTAEGGIIQEGYVRALNNFERFAGAAYFSEQLPHLLAIIQHYSVTENPFDGLNAGNAMMEAMIAIGNAALYGDSSTIAAFNDEMLSVISVLRSFALLGETSLDMRWAAESDKKWIMPHSFNAIGKVAKRASDEVKLRLDDTILDVRTKTIAIISTEVVETTITKNYLASAGRQCEEGDALFGNCFVVPKVEDILTVTYSCSDNLVIRAQSSILPETLSQSCADMAEQESEFHAFFNTGGVPVTGDLNAKLEVIAFASPADYEKYAGEFFGIDTNNGGMYLEGSPEREGNQARFIAMQCEDSWVSEGGSCQYENQIYNLKHEFVHYLDGRYIKVGGYGSFDYNVAWSEGFSEYLANGADHLRTQNSMIGKTIPPLYNILFMSYDYTDLYQWGYFAMRYLSEQHKDEVMLLVQAQQTGIREEYTEALKGIAQRTQAGFQAFMLANSTTVAPINVALPALNTFGHCDLAQQYVRPIDANKTELTITNTTDIPVSLFWISYADGKTNFSKNYKALNKGDSFISSAWSETDRMMLTDNNMNCLGVAVLSDTANDYTIDAEFVKDVIVEDIPAQDQLGSCSLAQPHLILDTSHSFTITNTTDYPIRLFRVDNMEGTPIYTSGAPDFDHGYGTLAKGESYSNEVWYGNRRLMVTDVSLNCLAVGVLNNLDANFTIDENIIANAVPVKEIPEPHTIGSCDLMEKHLVGPFEADFSFTNNTDTPVRIFRVDNNTGELSDSFGFTTLNQGETYDSASTWRWYGNRRAAITDENNNCLGVAVMSEKDLINDYQINAELVVVDSDGDGISDSEDAFPNDPTEWLDSDNDGMGDNSDRFPNKVTPAGDMDGDLDVDKVDIRAFSMALRRKEFLDGSFDLNADGVVNSRDLRLMRNECTYYRCGTEESPQ